MAHPLDPNAVQQGLHQPSNSGSAAPQASGYRRTARRPQSQPLPRPASEDLHRVPVRPAGPERPRFSVRDFLREEVEKGGQGAKYAVRYPDLFNDIPPRTGPTGRTQLATRVPPHARSRLNVPGSSGTNSPYSSVQPAGLPPYYANGQIAGGFSNERARSTVGQTSSKGKGKLATPSGGFNSSESEDDGRPSYYPTGPDPSRPPNAPPNWNRSKKKRYRPLGNVDFGKKVSKGRLDQVKFGSSDESGLSDEEEEPFPDGWRPDGDSSDFEEDDRNVRRRVWDGTAQSVGTGGSSSSVGPQHPHHHHFPHPHPSVHVAPPVIAAPPLTAKTGTEKKNAIIEKRLRERAQREAGKAQAQAAPRAPPSPSPPPPAPAPHVPPPRSTPAETSYRQPVDGGSLRVDADAARSLAAPQLAASPAQTEAEVWQARRGRAYSSVEDRRPDYRWSFEPQVAPPHAVQLPKRTETPDAWSSNHGWSNAPDVEPAPSCSHTGSDLWGSEPDTNGLAGLADQDQVEDIINSEDDDEDEDDIKEIIPRGPRSPPAAPAPVNRQPGSGVTSWRRDEMPPECQDKGEIRTLARKKFYLSRQWALAKERKKTIKPQWIAGELAIAWELDKTKGEWNEPYPPSLPREDAQARWEFLEDQKRLVEERGWEIISAEEWQNRRGIRIFWKNDESSPPPSHEPVQSPLQPIVVKPEPTEAVDSIPDDVPRPVSPVAATLQVKKEPNPADDPHSLTSGMNVALSSLPSLLQDIQDIDFDRNDLEALERGRGKLVVFKKILERVERFQAAAKRRNEGAGPQRG